MSEVWAYGTDEYGETQLNHWHNGRTQRIRHGYRIGSASPRLVGNNAKNLEEATQDAKHAAEQVRKALADMGAPADVSWWVQEGVTTISTEWSEPNIEALP